MSNKKMLTLINICAYIMDVCKDVMEDNWDYHIGCYKGFSYPGYGPGFYWTAYIAFRNIIEKDSITPQDCIQFVNQQNLCALGKDAADRIRHISKCFNQFNELIQTK